MPTNHQLNLKWEAYDRWLSLDRDHAQGGATTQADVARARAHFERLYQLCHGSPPMEV